METLKNYFAEMGRGSLTELADKVGITKAHLSDMSHGRRRISLEIAFDIEKATNGKVQARQLYAEAKRQEDQSTQPAA